VRQRMIGNALVLFGLLVLATGMFANRATASDDLPKYQDKVDRIEGSRSYNAGTKQTTFVFNATFKEQVSHITVTTCPENTATVVSATGPSGTKTETGKDPSINHTGVKFEPGKSGTYTVVFSGDVAGADFIVKNGDGHKHYSMGTGCGGTPVTTSSSATTATSTPAQQETPTTTASTTTTTAPTTTTTAPTTTTTAPTTTTTTASTTTTTTEPPTTTTTTASTTTTTTEPPTTTTTTASTTTTTTEPTTTTTTTASTTTTTEPPTTTTTGLLPDILGETTTTTAASTTSSSATTATTAAPDSSTTTTTAAASVLGSQLERPTEPLQPAPSVLGATETTPDAVIPNTGSNTGDYLLLAGVALVLGGLAVRFGQADSATGH
jgi:LPXTG-motif cell wall-anchored protein